MKKPKDYGLSVPREYDMHAAYTGGATVITALAFRYIIDAVFFSAGLLLFLLFK